MGKRRRTVILITHLVLAHSGLQSPAAPPVAAAAAAAPQPVAAAGMEDRKDQASTHIKGFPHRYFEFLPLYPGQKSTMAEQCGSEAAFQAAYEHGRTSSHLFARQFRL